MWAVGVEFQTCRSTQSGNRRVGVRLTPVRGAGVDGSSWEEPVSLRLLAGIVNAAGSRLGSSQAELNLIYNNLAITTDFNDIKTDFCGPTAGFLGKLGWDPCTGIGSVKGKIGK
jgi:hypothetical protein